MQNKRKAKRDQLKFEYAWHQECVKLPMSIVMEQFQISNCEECDIWLFDCTAGVYVDACRFCRVFIAASQASVFVRDCQYVQIVCATQQFRVRNCQNCDFSILCQSQPIIQSSSKIVFRCFPDFGYQQLLKQIEQCRISIWDNNWFDVHDFTIKQVPNYELKLVENQRIVVAMKDALKRNALVVQICLVPCTLGRNSQKKYYVLVQYPVPTTKRDHIFKYLQTKTIVLSSANKEKLGLPKLQSPDQKYLFIKIVNQSKPNKPSQSSIILSTQQQLDLCQQLVFTTFQDER